MRENKDTVSANFPKVRKQVSIWGVGKHLKNQEIKKIKRIPTGEFRLFC